MGPQWSQDACKVKMSLDIMISSSPRQGPAKGDQSKKKKRVEISKYIGVQRTCRFMCR